MYKVKKIKKINDTGPPELCSLGLDDKKLSSLGAQLVVGSARSELDKYWARVSLQQNSYGICKTADNHLNELKIVNCANCQCFCHQKDVVHLPKLFNGE